MNKPVALLYAAILALLVAPASLASDACRLDLGKDFRVSSSLLEVSFDGEVLYQIRHGGELTVAGEAVALSDDQRALAEQYAGDVGALAAQWIELVSAALERVGESLQIAFGAAFGPDSAATVKSVAAAVVAKEKFDAMARDAAGVYRVNSAEFNDFGAVITEDIEEAVQASLGSLLVEIGTAMAAGEGTFEQRMEAFGQRMEVMGGELERMGQSLEETSATLCAELRQLQALEREVAEKIPELADYPLFAR